MIRVIVRVSIITDRLCRSAAVGFFTTMLLIVLFQVVARYIFRTVPVWTEETARYCMVWGGLLGATVAFRADSDPRLIQPPRTGSRIWIFTAALLRTMATVVFLGPVLYFSDQFLERTWPRSTEALGIPTFWVTVSVPLAIIIIFLHLISRVFNVGDKLGFKQKNESEA